MEVELAGNPPSGGDPPGQTPGGPPGNSAAAPDRGTVTIHVAGDVREPGLVQVPVGARVADAIALAGGLRYPQRFPGVNLARAVADGEQILVSAPRAGAVSAPAQAAGVPAAGALVNLNTATAAELEELPGVGPVTSAAILQWRAENGSFADVSQLQEVSGIGEARMATLAPLVTVG